ncbi:MAG: GntR family transcriptional regulator [Oscillospiraceae bacterium]|nr:GntR family transcriptional regulator [Oscillospiraceae bacterium]
MDMIIEINTQSLSPIYEQLRDQIVLGIAKGWLEPGEELPSVRRFAADLGINFHTVNKVYSLLADEGYITMDRRKGAMVSSSAIAPGGFSKELSQRILLSAAESICHGIGEEEFISICTECYQNAKGE